MRFGNAVFGKLKRIICALIFILFTSTAAYGQGIVLAGKVRDNNTYNGIPQVNIYVEGTGIGTVTNSGGRYILRIPKADPDMVVVYQHVAYDTLRLKIKQAESSDNIYLQERIIPLPAVEVEAEGEKREIEKDIPQAVSVLEGRNFQLRGFIDAGDLLRTDHSVQVDEDLSGKKTVAIRGGNPDEVVVLYNGVKLNSAYDNVFDLSLIDLDNVERFEIIKGSNTSLYGPEAFSGVVNIVPRSQQDYHARFRQRFGAYDSGNWGLNLYQNLHRLYGSYNYSKGASSRKYTDEALTGQYLKNRTENQTANLVYNFSEAPGGQAITSLGLMYVRTRLDYDNQRDNESLLNFNQLVSTRFQGDIGRIRNLTVSGAYQWLDETQFLLSGLSLLDRRLKNRATYFNFEKDFRISSAEFFMVYQFENTDLDFRDDRGGLDEENIGLQQAALRRRHHGFASLAKFKAPTGSDFVDFIDFDVSFRYDNVRDDQLSGVSRDQSGGVSQDSVGIFGENNWSRTMLKFSSHIGGGNSDFAFNAYMNAGTNVKFPTLLQQISSPRVVTSPLFAPNLDPETNHSLEIGLVLMRELRQVGGIYGWQVAGNYFRNSYDNKFRSFYTPGIPVAFYDNIPTASISGFEAKPSIFLLNKKLTVDLGISRYFISEKAAFPFKYDFKRTVGFNLDHLGYSIQFLWFTEGEEIGWIRDRNGGLTEVNLPAFNNIDFHFGKTFEFGRFKLFLNGSGRNLLNRSFDLNGLAIRDRRFYVTFGAQY